MDDQFEHGIVEHLSRYVDGNIHTNGLENFLELLKRGINGTYVSVEPFHLFRYVDEQAFRFNTRKHADGEVISDGERFEIAMRQIVGKRLTYKQLTEGGGNALHGRSFLRWSLRARGEGNGFLFWLRAATQVRVSGGKFPFRFNPPLNLRVPRSLFSLPTGSASTLLVPRCIPAFASFRTIMPRNIVCIWQ